MGEIVINFIWFLIGMAVLVTCADWLIHCSVKLSFLTKISPFFIGLIIIAFGTSVPEAGVSIIASLEGNSTLALGNIVGSNISNIALIIGMSALFFPLKVGKEKLRKEIPFMFFVTVLLYFFSWDLTISRWEGIFFILLFFLFFLFSCRKSRHFDITAVDSFQFHKILKETKSIWFISILLFLSLGGVFLGARLMVDKGVYLANVFGVSPWIISVTVFAIGTSLPELVTSLMAAIKRVSSISIGNIIGSNIFNILFILGISSVIKPITLSKSILKFEMPMLLFFTLAFFTLPFTGYKISRREGVILVVFYMIFLFFVFRQ